MFNCAKCGEALTEPGGLAFSPPEEIGNLVEKFHICPPCWGYFLRWLYCNGQPVFPLPPIRNPWKDGPTYPSSPDWPLPEGPGLPVPKPGEWEPPYRITCETGVTAGGSLTPR